MSEEQEDNLLFRSDPRQLLVKYQGVVEIIVGRYAASGYFPFSECKEVVQYVNERILIRINRIKELYNGSVKLKTYFSAIIRNIVTEYLRNIKRLSAEMNYETFDNVTSTKPVEITGIALSQEINRLKIVLQLFGHRRAKIELCMKLLFRLPVNCEDFFKYAKRSKKMVDEKFLEVFNSPLDITDRELFEHITPWFNAVEGKRNNADALRKWVKSRVGEIVDLMNGDPPRSEHTEETIGILSEKYYLEYGEILKNEL